MAEHDVFIDSTAFLGLLLPHDDHHAQSLAAFQRIRRENLIPHTSDLVIAEVANFLSDRHELSYAHKFLALVQEFPIIDLQPIDRQEIYTLFASQDANTTRLASIANVVLMRRMNISQILSFDPLYRDQFGLTLFG